MKFSLKNMQPTLSGRSIFVASTANVIGNVELKKESSVWFNAVIRGDNERIVIGSRTNIQDGAVLHTDPGFPLILEDGVTVGHMAVLHGCEVKPNCLIGIHATVLNGAVIGQDSLIGANTLVTEGMHIPERSLVLGSPGKVVRPLRDAEVSTLEESAKIYVQKAKLYANQLRLLSE